MILNKLYRLGLLLF